MKKTQTRKLKIKPLATRKKVQSRGMSSIIIIGWDVNVKALSPLGYSSTVCIQHFYKVAWGYTILA